MNISKTDIARLINRYGNYSRWKTEYQTLTNNLDESSIEFKYYFNEWLYCINILDSIEMELAENEIFIHGKLSEQRLAKFDSEAHDKEWHELVNKCKESEKAFKSIQSN